MNQKLIYNISFNDFRTDLFQQKSANFAYTVSKNNHKV